LDVDLFPIIETGAFECPIVDRESEWLDQVERRTGGEAKPADVAGIGRNLRLDEDDVEGGGVMQGWSNGVLDLKRLPYYSTTPSLHCF
jgi:hypothetical protein